MKKQLSNLLFLAATVIWGFAFVAQKAAADLPAFTVGAVRSLFAALFLLALLPIGDKFSKNKSKSERRSPLEFNRDELMGELVKHYLELE